MMSPSLLGAAGVSSPPSKKAAEGGLGFSEVLELLARIALDSLQQPSFEGFFPTPFSKVLALLSFWGVADLQKLEEVRVVHTEEIY